MPAEVANPIPAARFAQAVCSGRICGDASDLEFPKHARRGRRRPCHVPGLADNEARIEAPQKLEESPCTPSGESE